MNRVLGFNPGPDGKMPKLLEGPHHPGSAVSTAGTGASCDSTMEPEPTPRSHEWSSQVKVGTRW